MVYYAYVVCGKIIRIMCIYLVFITIFIPYLRYPKKIQFGSANI